MLYFIFYCRILSYFYSRICFVIFLFVIYISCRFLFYFIRICILLCLFCFISIGPKAQAHLSSSLSHSKPKACTDPTTSTGPFPMSGPTEQAEPPTTSFSSPSHDQGHAWSPHIPLQPLLTSPVLRPCQIGRAHV